MNKTKHQEEKSARIREKYESAVWEYVQVKNNTPPRSTIQFLDSTFHFLQGSFGQHVDTPMEYHMACSTLLQFLSQPKVAQQWGKYSSSYTQDNLIRMMDGLMSFLEMLKDESYQALLDMHYVNEYWTQSDEEMEDNIQMYQVKTEAEKMIKSIQNGIYERRRVNAN